MKIICLALIILTLALMGCNKDEANPEIRAGKAPCNNCAMYRSYDSLSLTGGYNIPASVFLDVNNDGTDDFSVEAIHQGSPGGLSFSSSRVKCLHEGAFLAAKFIVDTMVSYWVKSAVDTTIQPPPLYDSTAFFYTKNYTADMTLPDEYEFSVSDYAGLLPVEYNYAVSESLNWLADTLIMISHNSTGYYYSVGNTLYGNFIDVYEGLWHPDDNKYVGIKVSGKFGWVHISTPASNQVIVFESLILK
ncbi:MAG: hypothetical protein JXA03_05495 [Bacteroidales bacterium]|nr:hypothetical protein [Bacteroidales bacterium]